MEEHGERACLTVVEDSLLPLKKRFDGGAWSPDTRARASVQALGYTLHEVVGEGRYTKVKRAYSKHLKTDVAIKSIRKCIMPTERYLKFAYREVSIMQNFSHENLIILHEAIATKHCLYLVMEYAKFGDMCNYIQQHGRLTEAHGRMFFRQLLNAVSYLHEERVCHRDIKCENLLLVEEDHLKLADFGFAIFNKSGHMLSTHCGSYVYAAPEIMDGETYDGFKADIWSMGVCLYAMLCGRLPFADLDSGVLRLAMDEKVRFCRDVPKDCRKIVRKMLTTDPAYRISLSDIRRSGWLSKPINVPPAENARSSSSVSSTAVSLDVAEEHGFGCDQRRKEVASHLVSDLLRAVAINHSITDDCDQGNLHHFSGGTNVGVAGPAGRRLSMQLQAMPEFKERKQSILSGCPQGKPSSRRNTISHSLQHGEPLLRRESIGRAAFRRFSLQPSGSGSQLHISVSQALQSVQRRWETDTQKELDRLRHSASGKAATGAGEIRRRSSVAERRNSLLAGSSAALPGVLGLQDREAVDRWRSKCAVITTNYTND